MINCRFSQCHIFYANFDSGSNFEHGSIEHLIVIINYLKMILLEVAASNYHLIQRI